jgi:hypothetical protein
MSENDQLGFLMGLTQGLENGKWKNFFLCFPCRSVSWVYCSLVRISVNT